MRSHGDNFPLPLQAFFFTVLGPPPNERRGAGANLAELQPSAHGPPSRRAACSGLPVQRPASLDALCGDVSREKLIFLPETQNLAERGFDPRTFGL